MHAGTKLHKCLVCMKDFSQASHLREHQLIHSGDKPFRCHVCKKSFRRVDVLRTHEKTHRGATYLEDNVIDSDIESSEDQKDVEIVPANTENMKHGLNESKDQNNKIPLANVAKGTDSIQSNRPQIINVENLGTTSQYQDIVDAIRSKDLSTVGSSCEIRR